jgi:hypothetical protein
LTKGQARPFIAIYGEALVPALTAQVLSNMLDALLSGFDLELYDADEWLPILWVAQRMAARWEIELGKLSTRFAERKRREAQVFRKATWAFTTVRRCSHPSKRGGC